MSSCTVSTPSAKRSTKVDNLLGMWDRLATTDQQTFNFDPRSVDWIHYIREIHYPSIVKHAGVEDRSGEDDDPGPEPAPAPASAVTRSPPRRLRPGEHPDRLQRRRELHVLATRRLDTSERLRYVLRTATEAPRLFKLDRADRTDFLRYFYRQKRTPRSSRSPPRRASCSAT